MSTTAEFEQEMEEVRRLDTYRKEAQERKESGINGLVVELTRHDQATWAPIGDNVEKSLLLHALRTNECGLTKLDVHLRQLKKQDIASFFAPVGNTTGQFSKPSQDNVPVLRAATTLQTLSETPGAILSRGAVGAYARILYELYSASKPNELLGGASAGGQGVQQTAFITLWCVRAITSLAASLRDAARLADAFDAFGHKRHSSIPKEWWIEHSKAVKLSAHITVLNLRNRSLSPIKDKALTDKYAETLTISYRKILTEAASNANAVSDRFQLLNRKERLNPFAALQALNMLEQLKCRCLQAAKAKTTAMLSKELRTLADEIVGVLRPVNKFFEAILDHELASADSGEGRVLDGAEILFAANGLVMLGVRDDPRLERALREVEKNITNSGRIPSHKPFDTVWKGYVLHVAGAEASRAFAELSIATQYPCNSNVVRRIIRYFEDTWRSGPKGWRHERDHVEGLCQPWLCAAMVEALETIVQMLNKRINQIVLGALSSRPHSRLNIDLESLFYPDFGLSALGIRKANVANALQRMRAHVYGIRLPKPYEQLHSAIFHGPPGTGKTTLAEALAKSSEVPLVEITPSDILLAGVEKIETRARIIFRRFQC